MQFYIVIHSGNHYGPYTKSEAEHIKQVIFSSPGVFSEPRIEPLLSWAGR